ncbi:MAG: hypothetical protein ACRD0W_24305 [Acidimicrobiales bacterium]
MTPIDDALARALHDLPLGAQAPLDRIKRRARRLRLHRRAAGVTIAFVAAAAVAVPTLTGAGVSRVLEPAAPSTSAPTPCSTTGFEGTPDLLTAEQVPDTMRLLWSEDAAPPPDVAGADDSFRLNADIDQYFAACATGPSVRLVDVEDGVVTRMVWLNRQLPLLAVEDQLQGRTLIVGETSVEVFARYGEWFGASWTRGGATWQVAGGPVTDTELAELVEDARATDSTIDVDDWSVTAEADHVIHRSEDVRPRIAYTASSQTLYLSTTDGLENLWSHADAGDRVVDVGGKPALLRTDEVGKAMVLWESSDGILAELLTDVLTDAEALLQIARTVEPVPPDDERLLNAWR